MAAARVDEGDLRLEAENRAREFLAKTPEPAQKYAVSNHEQVEEEAAKNDKAAEILADKVSSDAVLHRMAALEEMFTKQQALLTAALERMGFTPATNEEGKQTVRPPDVPLDAIITVYIPEGTEAVDKEPIPVGVNGNVRWIPRGVYTQVTSSELDVLQNAIYEGVEFPVVNDIPLSRKLSRDHLITSQPISYRRQRFPLMVQQLPH